MWIARKSHAKFPAERVFIKRCLFFLDGLINEKNALYICRNRKTKTQMWICKQEECRHEANTLSQWCVCEKRLSCVDLFRQKARSRHAENTDTNTQGRWMQTQGKHIESVSFCTTCQKFSPFENFKNLFFLTNENLLLQKWTN